MSVGGTWLHLPVEWYHREWQSKLVLSCFAAARGYSVMIGNQVVFRRNRHRLPRGIYLRKSFIRAQRNEILEFKDLGINSIGCDEEYFGYYNSENDSTIERRVDSESLSNMVALFVWGRKIKEIITEKYPSQKDKIFVTGSPRFDIYRENIREIHAGEAESYRKRFGRFILINSNFGQIVNSESIEDYMDHLGFKNLTVSDEIFEWEKDRYIYKRDTIVKFFEIIPFLKENFPEHAIIIRPHPTENHEHWLSAIKGIDNCHVIYEGVIGPWLLAADVMIHNGCSTAVESYFLRKRTIGFYPIQPGRFEEIGGKVSDKARTKEELICKVEMVLTKSGGDPEFDDWFEDYFLGLRDKYGSQRTVDAIDELMSAGLLEATPVENKYASMRPWMSESGFKRIHAMTRSFRYRYFRGRKRNYFPTPGKTKITRKWPIEETESSVQEQVNDLSKLCGLDCFLSVRELDINLFSIEKS